MKTKKEIERRLEAVKRHRIKSINPYYFEKEINLKMGYWKALAWVLSDKKNGKKHAPNR